MMEQINLSNILEAFNSAINEEQAWAVCYQCSKHFQEEWLSNPEECFPFYGLESLELSKEGNCCKVQPVRDSEPASSEHELVQSLGVVLFQALDYGLGEDEEHALSPPLEALIDRMTGAGGGAKDHEDEGIEEEVAQLTLEDILTVCKMHLANSSQDTNHYRAVVRALVTEALELLTFLDKIAKSKELKPEPSIEETDTVDNLQRHDWARLWIQIMKDLRKGVKLKKVDSVSLSSPSEFELTPYEILMEDIRTRRYTLKQVMVNGDIPNTVKKDAHELILEFIRSRPPLHPMKERKIKEAPPREVDAREALMSDIRQEHKLRPTPAIAARSKSPGRVQGDESPQATKKVIKPDIVLFDSDEDSDDLLSESEEEAEDEDKNKVTPSPLSPLTPLSPLGGPGGAWGKTHAKDKEKDTTDGNANERRHSITLMQSPTSEQPQSPDVTGITGGNIMGPHGPHGPIQGFIENFSQSAGVDANELPRSLQSSLECLSLTIEEVMHIRNVLTKAELECLLIHPDLHELVSKGKVCFTCKKTKFSLFGTWATKCKFCKRNICTKCVSKMRIPTEHFEHIPVYTLSPSPLSPNSQADLFVYENSLQEKVDNKGDDKVDDDEDDVFEVKDDDKEEKTPEKEDQGSGQQTLGPGEEESMAASVVAYLPEFLTQAAASGGLALGQMRAGRRSSAESSAAALRRSQLQRSQTVVRPEPPKPAVQGPLMDICKDCKGMVVNIIRASRLSLALAPSERHSQAPIELPPSNRPSRNFTLNLKPVYNK